MKYMSRPKSAAVKNIDIDTADILGQNIDIDIGKGDIDPALICINYYRVKPDFDDDL